jgi:hypothetical protein
VGRGLASSWCRLAAVEKVAVGFAFRAEAEARFFGSVAGPLVFGGGDGQPHQFDHRLIVGDVATVLDDLAQLVSSDSLLWAV